MSYWHTAATLVEIQQGLNFTVFSDIMKWWRIVFERSFRTIMI